MPEVDELKIKITIDDKNEKEYARERAARLKLELQEAKDRGAALKSILAKELIDYKAAQQEKVKIARETAAAQKKESAGAFGMSGDMKEITSWRELTLAIRNAKSAVVEFGASTKMVGSDRTYGQWLNDLTDKKQIVQRAAGQTSEQLLAMSRDFTVVSLAVRNLVGDIGELTKGDKSFPQIAAGLAGITTQALIVTPALISVSKTFQAMGGSALFLGGSAFATLTAGIVAVGSAFTVMYSAIKSLPDALSRIPAVLSGQMSYWQALKETLRDNTLGIVDFTDSVKDTEDPLLTMVRNLGYLTSAAHYTSEAFQNLKSDVDKAVDRISEKVALFHQLGFALTPEEMGPPAPPKKERTTTGRTGTSPSVKEVQKKLNLIDLEEEKLKKLKTQLDANLGDFGAELQIRKQIAEVEREIFRLRTGVDTSAFGFRARTIGFDDTLIRDRFRGKLPGTPTLQSSKRAEDFQDNTVENFQQMRNATEEMLGLFGQMDSTTKKILDSFLSIIEGLLSGGKGGGVLGMIFGGLLNVLLPGSGAVAGIGGGGGGIAGMVHTNLPPVGNQVMPQSSMRPINYITIKDVVSLHEGLQIEESYASMKNG